MSDTGLEPAPSSSPQFETQPASTLGARLTNILVSPGTVFDEIKLSPPQHGNWILPVILAIISGCVYAILIYSQPAILHRVTENQAQVMQKKVAAGKLTQQKADQYEAAAEKFMTAGIMSVATSLIMTAAVVILFFLPALAIWLVGRHVFHAAFAYAKAMEIVGLATVTAVPGFIISALVAIICSNPSITPGPALLISHFDAGNKIHLLLSTMSIFSLWAIALMAFGLAKFSGTVFWKAAAWGFALWAVMSWSPVLIF